MSKNRDYWLEIIESKPEDIGIVGEKLSRLTKDEINEEIDFEGALFHGAPLDIYIPHTPLMLASSIGRLDIIKLLIENESEIDKANNYGATALMAASIRGQLEVVMLLVEHKADVDKADNNGGTSLYLASAKGHLEIAKFLAEHKADVDKANNNGVSSLMAASYHGHLEVAKFFVEHGADVNHLSEHGTPLSWALSNIRNNPKDSTKIEVAKEIVKTLLTSTKYSLDLPDSEAVEVVRDILRKAPLFVPFKMPEVFSEAEDPGIIQAMVEQNQNNLKTSLAPIDGLFNEIYLIKTILFPFLGDGQEEFKLEAARKLAMHDVDGDSLSQDASAAAYVELAGGD